MLIHPDGHALWCGNDFPYDFGGLIDTVRGVCRGIVNFKFWLYTMYGIFVFGNWR